MAAPNCCQIICFQRVSITSSKRIHALGFFCAAAQDRCARQWQRANCKREATNHHSDSFFKGWVARARKGAQHALSGRRKVQFVLNYSAAPGSARLVVALGVHVRR